MRVSPEKLAEQFLSEDCVGKEDKKALFFRDALVCLFDGLILFRGDLNMSEAIPRLDAMATGLGLPIAVVEKAAANAYSAKKFRAGKHIGPGNWLKNSWNSNEGFDFGLKEKYNDHGYLIEEKEEEEKAETKPTTPNTTNVGKGNYNHVDRSHLGRQQQTASKHGPFFDSEDEYNQMLLDQEYGWSH